MKQVLLGALFCVLFSINVSADVLYSLARLKNVNNKISNATLNANGALSITYRNSPSNYTVERTLAKSTLDRIVYKIQSLNQEKLEKEVRESVCMYIRMPDPIPDLQIGQVIEVEKGYYSKTSPKTVLSDERCHVKEVTRPKTEAGRLLARNLREILVILAEEIYQQEEDRQDPPG